MSFDRPVVTHLVLVLVLGLAGCRLHFDENDAASADGSVDADPIVAKCGTAIICDDFEDAAFMPWQQDLDGGTIDILAGCGTNGSRCMRSSVLVNKVARYEYESPARVTRVEMEAMVTLRLEGTGSNGAQLLTFNLGDATSTTWQVGLSATPAGLRFYEYEFQTQISSSTTVAPPFAIGVPTHVRLAFDLAAKTLSAQRDGVMLMSRTLQTPLGESNVFVQLGVFVSQTAGWEADFDDVRVRNLP